MYSEIGLKINELRKGNKVSAKSLAEKIGVTTQQIYKYEKGINRIPVAGLIAISQMFNKPVEYFFTNQLNIK